MFIQSATGDVGRVVDEHGTGLQTLYHSSSVMSLEAGSSSTTWRLCSGGCEAARLSHRLQTSHAAAGNDSGVCTAVLFECCCTCVLLSGRIQSCKGGGFNDYRTQMGPSCLTEGSTPEDLVTEKSYCDFEAIPVEQICSDSFRVWWIYGRTVFQT